MTPLGQNDPQQYYLDEMSVICVMVTLVMLQMSFGWFVELDCGLLGNLPKMFARCAALKCLG